MTEQKKEEKEEDETEFYNFITTIPKISNTENSLLTILKKDTETIYDLIINDYRTNIQLAAFQDLKYAYLCIYDINAKHKNIIPIDNFIRINPTMQEQLNLFQIISIITRLEKKLHPFKVEIQNLENNQKIAIIVRW